MDKIAVLIPCYNESKTIEKVVKDFKSVLPWSGQPGQLVQGGEGVAHLLPLGQQVIQDRSVGGGGRVEQHDGSVVDAGQQFGIGLLRRRLIVRVPVHIGQTPEHGGVSQLLGLLQILHTVFSLRRAVELGERLSCGLLVQGPHGFF